MQNESLSIRSSRQITVENKVRTLAELDEEYARLQGRLSSFREVSVLCEAQEPSPHNKVASLCEKECDVANGRMYEIASTVSRIKARTLEEIRVKVRILQDWCCEEDDVAHMLSRSLCNDLLDNGWTFRSIPRAMFAQQVD